MSQADIACTLDINLRSGGNPQKDFRSVTDAVSLACQLLEMTGKIAA